MGGKRQIPQQQQGPPPWAESSPTRHSPAQDRKRHPSRTQCRMLPYAPFPCPSSGAELVSCILLPQTGGGFGLRSHGPSWPCPKMPFCKEPQGVVQAANSRGCRDPSLRTPTPDSWGTDVGLWLLLTHWAPALRFGSGAWSQPSPSMG